MASEGNETQRNTELALYVLRWLEQQRDPRERIWPGDRRLQTLQSTCQVLEALHELNLKGLVQHLVDPAANWLLELPLELPAEDLRSFRLVPQPLQGAGPIGQIRPGPPQPRLWRPVAAARPGHRLDPRRPL